MIHFCFHLIIYVFLLLRGRIKGEKLLFYEKSSYQTVIDSSQIVAMSRKREMKRKMSLHGLF